MKNYLIVWDADKGREAALEAFFDRIGTSFEIRPSAWVLRTDLDMGYVSENVFLFLGSRARWFVCEIGNFTASPEPPEWNYWLTTTLSQPPGARK